MRKCVFLGKVINEGPINDLFQSPARQISFMVTSIQSVCK